MNPFVVTFLDLDLEDLPVFAADEAAAAELGRQEAFADFGDRSPAIAVRAGEVVTGSVEVKVYLADPDAADEQIRERVPATFLTDSMRIGSGEIVCDTDATGPGVYKVNVPIDLVRGGAEDPESRITDAQSLIESYLM